MKRLRKELAIFTALVMVFTTIPIAMATAGEVTESEVSVSELSEATKITDATETDVIEAEVTGLSAATINNYDVSTNAIAVNTYVELQNTIASATIPIEIEIGNSFSFSYPIQITSGSAITLKATNEITLSAPNNARHFIIESGGTLTIEDGIVIDGTVVTNGGGVSASGIFNMQGGKILGNKATNGGGVIVNPNGTFNMTGGIISNNTSTQGGGVFVHPNGNFTMNGGKITDNIATEYGGGVAFNESINIGNVDIVTISANKLGNGTLDNVELYGTDKINLIGIPAEDSEIGITVYEFDGNDKVIAVGEGIAEASKSFFKSDNANYTITNKDANNLILTKNNGNTSPTNPSNPGGSNGGSSSGGSSSDRSTDNSTPNNQNTTPKENSKTITGGTATVSTQETNKSIENAIDNNTNVVINLPANTSSATFASADISRIQEAGLDLAIAKDGITFTIPNEALKQYVSTSAKQVVLSMTPVSETTINSFIEKLKSGSLLKIFELKFTIDGKDLTSFTTPLKISVKNDFNLTANSKATGFKLNLDNTPSFFGGSLNTKTNTFDFVTDRLSTYGVMLNTDLKSLNFAVDSKAYKLDNINKKTDVAPFIESGRTLVPLRVIAEGLGADIDWNEGTRTVTMSLDGKTINLTIGIAERGMDVPAQIVDGRTVVPLRYVSENLGANVVWDASTKEIKIYK